MKRAEKRKLKRALLKQIEKDPEVFVDLYIQLLERVEKLEDQLKKNSSNSSKPPSSDKGSEKRPRPQNKSNGKGTKSPGGQPGHKGSTLQQVDAPDHTEHHRLSKCPLTGRKLTDADIVDEIRCQVFDIPEPKMIVTEHIYYIYKVPSSARTVHRPFLQGAKAPVQYGNQFGSLLVYLNDYQLIPLRRVSELCLDLYGHKISEDTLLRFRRPCFEHLSRFEEHIKKRLLNSAVLHSDETGIRIAGKTEWLHVLSNDTYTYLAASDHRGSDALHEMGILANYRGTLVHDCFKSYFKLDCEHALCNAHLLRELAFFIEVKGHRWAAKMKQLLCNALKKPQLTTMRGWNNRYTRILNEAKLEHPYTKPKRKKGQRGKLAKPPVNNLIERFETYRKAILRFITDKAVPFTNNQGERDLRMAKVQQKISGSFRTWKGAKQFARIRSYISTAKKQNLSVYQALVRAVDGNPMFC